MLRGVRFVVRVGLAVSAFVPALALVAGLRWGELGQVAAVLAGVCAAAGALLVVVLAALRHRQAEPLTCQQVQRADHRVLTFVLASTVPAGVVMLLAPRLWPALIALGGIFLLAALVYVRGGLFHLNPLLAIRYRVYEVTATNGTGVYLLSRARHIPQDAKLQCRFLTDEVAVQVGD